MTFEWFLIILFIVFLLIGFYAGKLAKAMSEQKLKYLKIAEPTTDYVKFISNFKKGETLENNGIINEAVLHYRAALNNLENIDKKDELVHQNINFLQNKIKILDKSLKKVHNK